MKKVCILILFLSFHSLNATPLNYLNTLRSATGLVPFTQNSHLQTAAQNHSNYMQQNHTYGHTENSGNPGYTGTSPSVRTSYTGFSSKYISENVSYGTPTVEDSIDGLFSAIYHRFGFLNPSYNLIGIGTNQIFYTYDLSNSIHNQLCQNPSYAGNESYYTSACSDSTKSIAVTEYNAASNHFKSTSPSLILWPAEGMANIPPVFYEESPDPLPTHSVTGYPISIEFNDQKFSTVPTVTNFTLHDNTNTPLDLLTTMIEANDPAQRFTAYQIAIFPKKRLAWGSRYTASVSYDVNSISHTSTWCFSTKSLTHEAPNFYKIENNSDIQLKVRTNETYAFYVVPNHSNDKLSSVSYSYNVSNVDFSYIDSNTVKIRLSGGIGSYAIFTFENGQKITLTIQNDDTSTPPKNETCPLPTLGIYEVTTVLSINTITNTPTPIDIILTLNKPNDTPATEALVVSLPKNHNMSLNFDSSLQTLQGYSLSNNAWSLSQTPNQHRFTYIPNNGILPNHTTVHLGITSLFSPPLDKKGTFTFNAHTLFETENTENQNTIINYSNLPN